MIGQCQVQTHGQIIIIIVKNHFKERVEFCSREITVDLSVTFAEFH